MMRFLTILFVLITAVLFTAPAARADTTQFWTLCYHNVEDDNPDQRFVGVTTAKLIEQIAWLKENGFHFISVDDIIAARDGTRPLPDKAVLMTVDDGYESAYTKFFPILKAYNVPAVVAVVGEWLLGKPGESVHYGDSRLPREAFLTWNQIREMAHSGLIEIASHTNSLHFGAIGNPQGNTEPAVVTHQYDKTGGRYETDQEFKYHLNYDAATIARTIEQETGQRPRITVWPYGEHSQLAINIVTAHGMPITFGLGDGLSDIHNLADTPRTLIDNDPSISDFSIMTREITKIPPQRAVQVDLDYVYDPDPVQQDKNVGALVQRIHDLQISTVFLQAFADPDASGIARQVYFPNSQLPVRADLFNRVAWQIKTRTDSKVYAWLPVLAYDFGDDTQHVESWDPNTHTAKIDPKAYQRLSVFDETARAKIGQVYAEMAKSSPVDGLLFSDDAQMSDFEDASPPALAAYATDGLPGDIDAIRADPALMQRWTDFKSTALINFTKDLAQQVKLYRVPLQTARNIYALPVLDPASQAWFSQEYPQFLQAYDYTAIMAMPYMENVPAGEENEWLRHLIAAVAAQPLGLKKSIFELQTVDWRKQDQGNDRAIPTETLNQQMRLLQRLGALNIGYYPDDFVTNQPDVTEIHKSFSLQSYPYEP